jgi:hypothetical protein
MASLSLVPEHPADSQSSRGPGTAMPLRPGPGSVQQDEPPAPRAPPRRSSQEIANLASAEAALDAMVVSYHKDRAGRKLYETMLDSWKSDELRLVADRVGTIDAKGANCSKVMRDALGTAIESHAEKNPHLLVNQEDAPIQLNSEVAVVVDSDDDDSVEQKESDRRRVPKPRQVKEKKKPALSSSVLAAMGRIPSSRSRLVVSAVVVVRPHRRRRHCRPLAANAASLRRLVSCSCIRIHRAAVRIRNLQMMRRASSVMSSRIAPTPIPNPTRAHRCRSLVDHRPVVYRSPLNVRKLVWSLHSRLMESSIRWHRVTLRMHSAPRVDKAH